MQKRDLRTQQKPENTTHPHLLYKKNAKRFLGRLFYKKQEISAFRLKSALVKMAD
jgi:hypothetical protein